MALIVVLIGPRTPGAARESVCSVSQWLSARAALQTCTVLRQLLSRHNQEDTLNYLDKTYRRALFVTYKTEIVHGRRDGDARELSFVKKVFLVWVHERCENWLVELRMLWLVGAKLYYSQVLRYKHILIKSQFRRKYPNETNSCIGY